MFTAISLAIAIGANTAIFSVIEGILLKPLSYPHSEQLIALWQKAPGVNVNNLNMSPSLYFTYSDENRTLQDLSIWTNAEVLLLNFSYRGIARMKPGVTIEQASADIARMIPMAPTKFAMNPGFSLKMFAEAALRDVIASVLGMIQHGTTHIGVATDPRNQVECGGKRQHSQPLAHRLACRKRCSPRQRMKP